MFTVGVAAEMEGLCLKSNVHFCCDPEMFTIEDAWPLLSVWPQIVQSNLLLIRGGN
jgi:hypothetical protein